MTKIGYARVSTDEQTVEQQIDALLAAGCDRHFVEAPVCGASRDRPALAAAKDALKPGDTFVVWAYDRAFRSTLDALSFLDDLLAQDIDFISLTQQIDTRTPEGRKWFIDIASWAEYERALISRRTRERMAAAKRRGQTFGRPRRLSKAHVGLVRQRHFDDGVPVRMLADEFDVSHDTITRALHGAGAYRLDDAINRAA